MKSESHHILIASFYMWENLDTHEENYLLYYILQDK